MEASLLPSGEIRDLCGRVLMTVVRRGEPSRELEKEFQVQAGAPCFIVLDAKGEMLARFAAGDVGAGCTPETVAQYPRLVAERITASLTRSESLETLERAWAAEKSGAAGANLAARLEEQKDFRRLADLCESLAAVAGAGGKTPQAWLLKALQHRAQTCHPPSVEKFKRLCELGGRILAEYPETPEAESAVTLLWRGCSHGFDVPARSARALQDLEKRGERLGEKGAAAFRARVDAFKTLRSETIRKMETYLQQAQARAKQPAASDYYLAWLGDAEAGVRFYGRSSSPGQSAGGTLSGNAFSAAEYQAYTAAMLEEAREKLRGAQKK